MLDCVGIDLTTSVFTHGQLYTALSQVRNWDSMMVLLLEGQEVTTNVTYQEILI